MEVFAGTGGYSNEDWVGILYPENAKPSQFLEIYSRYFNAVELNITFYVFPSVAALEGILRRGKGLNFSVKINREMTHDLRLTSENVKATRFILEKLSSGQGRVVSLAQFPYRFKNTPKSRSYLVELAKSLVGFSLFVEFRHSSWDNLEEDFLRDVGIKRVSSDYPPLKGLPSPRLYINDGEAYVRFHGRNRRNWWKGKDQMERHDYRYSYEELALWVRSIREVSTRLSYLWLIFNNTTKGHALYNLCMLKKLMPDLPIRIDEILEC
ncbi:MAG: DUF72 domain-containing protein [Thermotogae bacterium]|nr:DUF72 domain-containing protein [Thermotogota bacterium]